MKSSGILLAMFAVAALCFQLTGGSIAIAFVAAALLVWAFVAERSER
jgi:hypothetical protein